MNLTVHQWRMVNSNSPRARIFLPVAGGLPGVCQGSSGIQSFLRTNFQRLYKFLNSTTSGVVNLSSSWEVENSNSPCGLPDVFTGPALCQGFGGDLPEFSRSSEQAFRHCINF